MEVKVWMKVSRFASLQFSSKSLGSHLTLIWMNWCEQSISERWTFCIWIGHWLLLRVWTVFHHRMLLLLKLQGSCVFLVLLAGISKLIEIDTLRSITIDIFRIIFTHVRGRLIGLEERNVLLWKVLRGHWIFKDYRVNLCAWWVASGGQRVESVSHLIVVLALSGRWARVWKRAVDSLTYTLRSHLVVSIHLLMEELARHSGQIVLFILLLHHPSGFGHVD